MRATEIWEGSDYLQEHLVYGDIQEAQYRLERGESLDATVEWLYRLAEKKHRAKIAENMWRPFEGVAKLSDYETALLSERK